MNSRGSVNTDRRRGRRRTRLGGCPGVAAPFFIAGVVGVVGVVAAPALAQTVTKTDAKCRAAIAGLAGKYAATANKAVSTCMKARAGGATAPESCANPAEADAKTKLDKARAKLVEKIGDPAGKCGAASAQALAAFAGGGCPAPATVGAIDDFADVAACTVELVADETDGDGRIAAMWKHVLDPDLDAVGADKALRKCVDKLAKRIASLHKAVSKSRAKCQVAADKNGGAYAYGCSTDDEKHKIQNAEDKLRDTFDTACADLGAPALARLGSCEADADAVDCIVETVARNAGGLTATHFEYAGVCPAELDVMIRGTGEKASGSRFSAGWTGLLNDSSIPGGVSLAIDLSCPDGTCANCAPSASCRDAACRCADDPLAICDEPFGPDLDSCGGAECIVYIEPPRPINVSGSPACLSPRALADLAGTVTPTAGDYALRMQLEIGVYINSTQSNPCPICDAGPSPAIGDAGVCAGIGAAAPGAACTVDSVSPPFGPTSRDCQPASGGQIAAMPIDRTFTAQPKSLASQIPCTGSEASCPCGVCDNDPAAVCASNQDCVDAGVPGPCAGYTEGVPTLPNLCDDLTCLPSGECNVGSGSFCDGYLDEIGRGILACVDNTDCADFGPFCEDGDCGTCTHSEPDRCLPDPTSVDGDPTPDGPTLSALYCVAPTLTAIDPVVGFPGIATSLYDSNVVTRCPDGVTVWELGGSNCP